ncbi:cytochrome c oxidase VIIc family protein [Planotetraspora thailandica]|nr:cytochrome c oxidase VIIc family protein [Planotetraspora thailandica]
MMVNRYVVHVAQPDDSEGAVVAFAEQKRMALKEQVTLFTDESRQQPLAGFKARKVLDLAGEYDVVDGPGVEIGSFRKNFAKSLLRSTWNLQQPGLPTLTGQERNLPVALLRRFSDSLSWLPYHFDFGIGASLAFSVTRKWGLRDRYLIEIHDDRLDRRLVIAMAVALDALQAR